MSTLKSLRTRIKTVTSTQKITAAMKMVAAAKLRRSQEQAEGAKPYADGVRTLVQKTLQFGEFSQKPLLATGSDAPCLLILFSADRGLCGSFNATMLREFRKKAQTMMGLKKRFYCIGIGNKAKAFLNRHYFDYVFDELQPEGKFEFHEALALSRKITEFVNCKRIGRVEMIYTYFKSIVLLLPAHRVLVPSVQDGKDVLFSNSENPLFEPKPEELLGDLLELFISTELYSARLQSNASEQAARMTAMDSATRNAKDMVNKLKLTYNRTRQAIITKELIEIISGANAG